MQQETLAQRLGRAMEKLTKWRTVFAGWQLGTRSQDDPESQAVRQHRELSMVLRAEVNMLTALMLKKGLVSQEELQMQLLEEVRALDHAYEKLFPGFRTTDEGLAIHAQLAAQTTKHWRP